MRLVRPMIEIDETLCDGCGLCIPNCHEGALVIRDGKARLVADRLCDGLGACLGHCPKGALKVIPREAEPFDAPRAVSAAAPLQPPVPDARPFVPPNIPGSCPGSRVQTFGPLPAFAPRPNFAPAPAPTGGSPLGHWPVQIRLIPPSAPFLEGADLLIAADCVPVADPQFHSDLLPGKAVMIGCPKFDDLDEYTQRFALLFSRSNIQKVTVAVMEVPCCQALPVAVRKGLELAGKDVPVEVVVVGVRGGRVG